MSTPNDLLQSLENLSAPQLRRQRTAGHKRYDFPMPAVVTTPGGFHAQPT